MTEQETLNAGMIVGGLSPIAPQNRNPIAQEPPPPTLEEVYAGRRSTQFQEMVTGRENPFAGELDRQKSYRTEFRTLAAMYSDPENLGNLAPEVLDLASASYDPKTFKDMAVNWRATAFLLDTPVEELKDSDYLLYKKFVAAKLGKPEPKTETEYHAMLGEHFTKQRDLDDAIDELNMAAIVDALNATNYGKDFPMVRDQGRTISEWMAKYPELATPDRQWLLARSAGEMYQQTLNDLADVREYAAPTYKTLVAFTRGEATEEQIDELGRNLRDLTPEQFNKVGQYVTLAAEAEQIDRGAWTQLAKNLGESLSRGFDFIPAGDLQYGQAEATYRLKAVEQDEVWVPVNSDRLPPGQYQNEKTAQQLPKYLQMAKFGESPDVGQEGGPAWRKATPEEKEQIKTNAEEGIKSITMVRKLKNLAKTGVDPIRPLSQGGLIGAVERGAYGLSGSLPLMGMVAVNPFLGMLSYQQMEFDRIMLENENMDVGAAQSLALFEGALNSAIDRFQIAALMGKSKFLGGWMKGMQGKGVLNYLKRVGVTQFEQFSQENIQDLIAPVTETLVAALREDMPDKDFAGLMGDYINARPEVFFAVLPLALIGGGFASTGDLRNVNTEVTRERLRGLGFTEEKIADILASTTRAEMDSKIQEAWRTRTDEDIARGLDYLNRQLQQSTRTELDHTLAVERKADGTTEWVVNDYTGKEVGRFADYDAAAEVISQNVASNLTNERTSIAELMQWVEKSGVLRDPKILLDQVPKSVAQDLETFQATGDTKRLDNLMARLKFGDLQGKDPNKLYILGETTIEQVREGVYRAVLDLKKNSSPRDAFEEINHGFFKVALANGVYTLETYQKWLEQTEAATGRELKRATEMEVIESLAQVSEDWVMGRIDETSMPQSFVDYIKRIAAIFKEALARFLKMDEAFKTGAIDTDFQTALEQSLGIDPQVRMDRMRDQTAKDVAGRSEIAVRDMELFPETSDFFGKFDKPVQIASYFSKNGIGFATYTNPENGSPDVYIAAFGDNDFVAYMRVYENGTPTNRFTSKLERRTARPGATKAMVSELQRMLPENHQYMEDVSVSTDGMRFFLSQLGKGYEVARTPDGNPVTTEVAISGESITNDLGIPVDPNGKFENIRVTTPEQFRQVQSVLAPMLERFGVGLNQSNIRWENGSVFVDLPVLEKQTAAEVDPNFAVRDTTGEPDPKATDPATESGDPAPDVDINEIDPSKQTGEGWEPIPWREELQYSVRSLPTAFKDMDKATFDQILAASKAGKIRSVYIDRMKVGEYLGIDLQGGMFYPTIVENLQQRVVWAFNAKQAAKTVYDRAEDGGGYVMLALMQEGNVIGNKTFTHVWFKALDQQIAKRKITKTAALARLNEVREKFKDITGHATKWKSLDQAKDDFLAMPQRIRGNSYFKKKKVELASGKEKITYQNLLTQTMTKAGFPDASELVDNIEEPSFKGLPTQSIVGIIKIDKVPEGQNPVMTAQEAGVPEHLSYQFVLKGEPVAKMNKFRTLESLNPAIRDKILSQDKEPWDIQQALAYSVRETKKSADEIEKIVSAMSASDIRAKLESSKLTPTPRMVAMLGEFPQYLEPIVEYMMEKRQDLVDGKVSPRDVAKAYWMTIASIGADAIDVSTIAAKAQEEGIAFNPDPMFTTTGTRGQLQMRPEELAAYWLGTPEGQRALDNVEKGIFNPDDWQTGLLLRDAFGRNDLRERWRVTGKGTPNTDQTIMVDGAAVQVEVNEKGNWSFALENQNTPVELPDGMTEGKRVQTSGSVGLPKAKKANLTNLKELTDRINAAKGDPAKLEKAVMSAVGIGEGKKGFISHFLGFGGWSTIDAVELNMWLAGVGDTTRATEDQKMIAAIAKKASGQAATRRDLFDRIRKAIAGLRTKAKGGDKIPKEVAPHIIHHWIWDAAKNIQTTHEGLYYAMQNYSVRDFSKANAVKNREILATRFENFKPQVGVEGLRFGWQRPSDGKFIRVSEHHFFWRTSDGEILGDPNGVGYLRIVRAGDTLMYQGDANAKQLKELKDTAIEQGLELMHDPYETSYSIREDIDPELARYEGWESVTTTKQGRRYSPIVRDLLQRRANGENISRETIDRAINLYFPSQLAPVPQSEEELPSQDEVNNAVGKKGEGAVKKENIVAGQPVTIRQDVPSWTNHQVGVVTIDTKDGKAYSASAAIDNPQFLIDRKTEALALRIGMGGDKGPHIQIKGTWSEDQTMPTDLEQRTQVGYNPDRHSFYYDRATGQQIVGASHAYQIGNVVFVTDPQYGDGKISDLSYSIREQSEIDRVAAAVDAVNRGPEGRLAVYQRAKERFLQLMQDNKDALDAIKTAAVADPAPAIEKLEEDRAGRLADIETEEIAEVESALQDNAVQFATRIDEAIDPEDKAQLKADAKDRAKILEKGIREKYAERKKQVEQEIAAEKRKVSEVSESRRVAANAVYREKVKYEKLAQAIAELDGLLKVLPKEVIGKVGGFATLANIGTGEKALADFFVKRVEMVDAQLERYLNKEYDQELDKIFERAKPKKAKAGEKPKGIGAEIQNLFAVLQEARGWNAREVSAHLASIDDQIATGDLTAEQEAALKQEAALVTLVGNWKPKYQGYTDPTTGKTGYMKVDNGADSNRRATAVAALRETWARGFAEYRAREIAKRQQREADRQQAILSTGKTGDINKRKDKQLKDAGLGAKFRNALFNLVSWDQFTGLLFGNNSPVANRVSDLQRRADNQKEDAIQQKTEAIEALFTRLAGGKRLDGEKLRWEMSQMSMVVDGLKLSELEGLTATMMWMQADGKRHMEGRFDDNGNRISAWGYTQAFIDKIEGALSNEAKEVRQFLLDNYDREYNRINAVYRQLNGIDLPKIQFYSPLIVAPQQAPMGMVTDPVTGNAVSAASVSPGALRTRGNAVAEPQFRDALQTFIAHTKQMEHWIAYAPILSEVNGVLRNREVQNAIEEKGGIEARKVLNLWLDLFAQGGNRDASNQLDLSQQITGMAGRGAQMALVGRLGTLLIQSTQLGAAIAEMPTGSYVVRLSKLLTGNLGWGEALNSTYIQRRIREMPPVVQQALEGLAATQPNRLKYEVARIGRLISGTDGLMTAGTFAIVFDYHFTQARKMGFGEADARAYARNVAERATDRIAQPTRMGARSIFELTQTNAYAKVGWAFASEARKNLALAAYGIANRPAKDAARTIGGLLILNILFGSLIRNAWRDARDEEDDEWFDARNWSGKRLLLAAATEPFYGLPFIGSAIEEGVYAAAGEYNMAGNVLSPVRAIRALRNLPETLSGEREIEDMMKDLNGLMWVMGLFNQNIAAATSLSNIAVDAFSLGKNTKKNLEE